MSLARRNLLQDKTRLALSIRGVGLAITLILILKGFLASMNRQITSYLDHSPDTIVVAEEDVVTIMNLIGFMIGLAVMALTVYTSTLSRRQEYGMLKALGARNTDVYFTVLAQAMLSTLLGFFFGWAITRLLALAIPFTGLALTVVINSNSLIKVAVVSLILAGLSTMIPIRQIANLDPAMVFRGK